MPRSVSVLPRSPLSRRPIRASLGLAVLYPRCHATPSSPPSPPNPKVPRSVPKVPRHTLLTTARAAPVVRTNDCHRPAAPTTDGRPILAPCADRPAASSLNPRWRENSRRPREARLAPDTRLVVRGVVPTTTQSDLPLTRGNSLDRGRSPPQGGKPSAALSRQARLVEKRRARFWAASPPASSPTSREVRWKREAHIYGRRTHRRPRPAPDGTRKGNFWEK